MTKSYVIALRDRNVSVRLQGSEVWISNLPPSQYNFRQEVYTHDFSQSLVLSTILGATVIATVSVMIDDILLHCSEALSEELDKAASAEVDL